MSVSKTSLRSVVSLNNVTDNIEHKINFTDGAGAYIEVTANPGINAVDVAVVSPYLVNRQITADFTIPDKFFTVFHDMLISATITMLGDAEILVL